MNGGRKAALDVRRSTLGAHATEGGPRMARMARMGIGDPRNRSIPRSSMVWDGLVKRRREAIDAGCLGDASDAAEKRGEGTPPTGGGLA